MASCVPSRLVEVGEPFFGRDRKSTRLNSSHANTSYAVFCLKKKKLIQVSADLREGDTDAVQSASDARAGQQDAAAGLVRARPQQLDRRSVPSPGGRACHSDS